MQALNLCPYYFVVFAKQKPDVVELLGYTGLNSWHQPLQLVPVNLCVCLLNTGLQE